MITFTSLPRLRDLARLLVPSRIDEEHLVSPWCKPGDHAVWFSRTAWSLQAIVVWWEKTFAKNQACIWFPDYFCNQSLWPIRQTSAKIIFYPVDDNFQPNWQVCEKLALSDSPDIFVVVHFYGKVSDTKLVKSFCESHESIMVEDAAHVLVPVLNVGELGHFILYSQYKMFAIPHGALCVIRPSLEIYVQKMKGEKVVFDNVLGSEKNKAPSIVLWVIKRVIQKLIGNFFTKKDIAIYEEDLSPSPMVFRVKASYCSKKLLSFSINKIAEYAQHRRKCISVWDETLHKNKINFNRPHFSVDEIPYVAVYNFSQNKAVEVYYKLAAKKWPVGSWPDLPPEIKENQTLYRQSICFRNSFLTLPVHHTLNFCQVRKLDVT